MWSPGVVQSILSGLAPINLYWSIKSCQIMSQVWRKDVNEAWVDQSSKKERKERNYRNWLETTLRGHRSQINLNQYDIFWFLRNFKIHLLWAIHSSSSSSNLFLSCTNPKERLFVCFVHHREDPDHHRLLTYPFTPMPWRLLVPHELPLQIQVLFL